MLLPALVPADKRSVLPRAGLLSMAAMLYLLCGLWCVLCWVVVCLCVAMPVAVIAVLIAAEPATARRGWRVSPGVENICQGPMLPQVSPVSSAQCCC